MKKVSDKRMKIDLIVFLSALIVFLFIITPIFLEYMGISKVGNAEHIGMNIISRTKDFCFSKINNSEDFYNNMLGYDNLNDLLGVYDISFDHFLLLESSNTCDVKVLYTINDFECSNMLDNNSEIVYSIEDDIRINKRVKCVKVSEVVD